MLYNENVGLENSRWEYDDGNMVKTRPSKKCEFCIYLHMINLLIIQGCQSGSVGQGGQLVRLVRIVRLDWWYRWSR